MDTFHVQPSYRDTFIYLFITIIDVTFKLASFKFDSFNVLVLLESEEFVLILATV